MKKILITLLMLGIVFALVGCGGKSSTSDVDKMLGKWTDKNNMGFTTEIKKEKDSYTLTTGDKYDPAALVVQNGYYDKEKKRLIFVEENKPSRKPHEFWYDSEKDELNFTHQNGTTGNYIRLKE